MGKSCGRRAAKAMVMAGLRWPPEIFVWGRKVSSAKGLSLMRSCIYTYTTCGIDAPHNTQGEHHADLEIAGYATRKYSSMYSIDPNNDNEARSKSFSEALVINWRLTAMVLTRDRCWGFPSLGLNGHSSCSGFVLFPLIFGQLPLDGCIYCENKLPSKPFLCIRSCTSLCLNSRTVIRTICLSNWFGFHPYFCVRDINIISLRSNVYACIAMHTGTIS